MRWNSIITHVKVVLEVLAATVALTYCSLLIPGTAMAVCNSAVTPVICPVLAYGFPLAFIADSQAVSPVGSVARDPLSLLAGIDNVLWPELGISALFWFDIVIICKLLWLRFVRED